MILVHCRLDIRFLVTRLAVARDGSLSPPSLARMMRFPFSVAGPPSRTISLRLRRNESQPIRARQWICVVMLVLASFFPLWAAHHCWQFLNDDSYITLTYAKSIAVGRGFVFNSPPPTLGTTTPLYAVAIAALSVVLARADISQIRGLVQRPLLDRNHMDCLSEPPPVGYIRLASCHYQLGVDRLGLGHCFGYGGILVCLPVGAAGRAPSASMVDRQWHRHGPAFLDPWRRDTVVAHTHAEYLLHDVGQSGEAQVARDAVAKNSERLFGCHAAVV